MSSTNGETLKKRAFKPKVKTGCLTCRKRRIKCDEGKPICLKCRKSGFDCDGYQSTPTNPGVEGRRPPSKRSILPKLPTTVTQAANSSGANHRAELLFQPQALTFNSEQEHRYYQVFCEKIAYQLAGYHEFTLWNYLILQAAEQEPSIRHALIAVGALEQTRRAGTLSLDIVANMDEHHLFAVKQYSIAIREMRAAIVNRVHSLRTTLLTCLLIICFESFHGNHESALAQIQAGLRLLEEWVGSKTRESEYIKQQSGKLSPQITESSSFPEAQPALATGHSLFDIVSPAPDTIEDEILQAFSRLDMQAMAFLDRRPIGYHRLMKNCGSKRLSEMPLKFNSLNESRGYYELIIRRLMHWIAATADFRRNIAPKVKSKLADLGGMGGGGILNRCQPQSEGILPEGFKEQQDHLDEMDEWHQRFLPMYQELCQGPFTRDWLAATGMELKWVCSRMALSAALGSDMMIYDQYLRDFKKIVQLVKILISYPQTLAPFAFDLAMIPQLYVVGIKCRDPQVRREAIALLLANPRREGVWDSVLAGKMATAVVEIEEREMVDGFIPSWARVRGTKMNFNLIKREGTLIALMSQTEPNGDVKIVKRTITW